MTMNDEPAFDQVAPCCTGALVDSCLCGPAERVLRAIADGTIREPLTDDQRAWCIDQGVHAGEGEYEESDLRALDDRALAATVLRAWLDYARSNCGL